MNEVPKIIPYKLLTSIHSYSHTLNEEAFSPFTTGETNIFVDSIKEKSFVLGIENANIECRTIEQFFPIGHLCFSNFIMALNIAALGHFTWELAIFPKLLYRYINPEVRKDEIIALEIPTIRESDVRDITKEDIRMTALLYGALCKENNLEVRKEYIKGVLHLSYNFYDITFYKEAFGNFYRSFEYFAIRMRGGKKLKKELRDLQNIIRSVGMGDELAAQFGELYKLRGEQVMHAQKQQTEIPIDDALKMKAILDAILHMFYKPVWEKGNERIGN